MCTESIHKALVDKGLPPREHLVDAGYVSAELLVRSQVHYGIDLVGPARVNATWQTKVEGAYTGEQFKIDWEQRVAHCPPYETLSSQFSDRPLLLPDAIARIPSKQCRASSHRFVIARISFLVVLESTGSIRQLTNRTFVPSPKRVFGSLRSGHRGAVLVLNADSSALAEHLPLGCGISECLLKVR